MDVRYAEVIVPLGLNAAFTYIVPPELATQVAVGSRVVVQFGARRFYTAIVASVSAVAPPSVAGVKLKEISEVLDSGPVIRRPQMQLWEWMAGYYLCSIGDMLRAALPSGLKLESETFVELAPEYSELAASLPGESPLSEAEAIVIQHLAHAGKRMSLSQLDKAAQVGRLTAVTASLMERGLVVISEKLVERYRTVKEAYVEVAGARGVAADHTRLFALVKGAPKQETALMALLEMTGFMRRDAELNPVTRKALAERAGVSNAVIAAMAAKGAVRVVQKEINRFSFDGLATGELPELSEAQRKALSEIHHSWLDHEVTLLHGVTSSGKTEIYIHLIDYVMQRGNQVLMLVPEIALTTQLTRRLQRVFGNKVVIYHSKFTDNERVDIWKRLLHSSEPCVVIGARSAVFLPFARLGLAIVDEEHESSYKQQDPAPRYNGRDVAIVLAGMHGAKTLLGSATPSVETNYKALSGRFGHVVLKERFGGVALPEIEVVDMTDARRRKAITGPFADRTSSAISSAVADGNQAIVFLNRRGYAPIAECRHCAYVPHCEHCDVTLTFHRRLNRLVCHYCGAEYPLPPVCPVCHEPGIEVHGYGTERIEESVQSAFPGAGILRMDLDTTRAKSGYDRIIDEFSQGGSDILVGTQMVTKGLDFGRVTVVAVVNADAMLHMPDYRASERAFNMLEQVAGRAGRRSGQGRVLIQTRLPEHPVIRHLLSHDYDGFYAGEIAERERYSYPPFTRLINIAIRHRDASAVVALSDALSKLLRHLFGNRVFGPEEPEVSRVQTYFIRRIMLKFELNVSMQKVKELLRDSHARLVNSGLPGAGSLLLSYDVDPG